MNTPPPNGESKPPNNQNDNLVQVIARSYLLRLWRSGVDSEWRASLQSVQTGERHMFADIGSLLTFLVEQVRSSA